MTNKYLIFGAGFLVGFFLYTAFFMYQGGHIHRRTLKRIEALEHFIAQDTSVITCLGDGGLPLFTGGRSYYVCADSAILIAR